VKSLLRPLDFQVLIRNQWIIVCSLVGLVALVTTIVDVATGRFGSGTTAQTQNSNQAQNQASPRQIANPKNGRQWVLDSSGGRDSDAKDFLQIVNGIQDGDTIQVRPGSYNGPLALAKSVTITGLSDKNTGARPSIRYSGGTGCQITGAQVMLENLDFSETSQGNSVLLIAQLQSVTQIKKCNFVSRGSDCLVAVDTAHLVAEDCTFQTLSQGFGCYVKGTAKATIERCTFQANRGCVDCIESGSLVINDCKFENNHSDAQESFLVRLTSTGSAEMNGCSFTDNTIPVISQQGSMSLTNCRFERNRAGGYWRFILGAGGSTSVTLTGCQFLSNDYAVVAAHGAIMQVEGCRFERGGQIPKDNSPQNDANLLAMHNNTQVTIRNTTFADVQFAGVLVADQAQAILQDTTIQGGQYGIDLGVTEQNLQYGGVARLQNVTFSGQTGQAVRLTRASRLQMYNCHVSADAWNGSIFVDTGSGLEMTNCELQGGKGNGLEAVASSSEVHAEQCQFLGFQGFGVLARNRAKIVLSGCTLQQNDVGAQAGGADEASEGGVVTLENCTIRSNRTYGVSAVHGGYVALNATTFSDQPKQTFNDPSSSVRLR